MSDLNNIDDLFREHQNDWDGKPKGTSWEKLTDRLDDKTVIKQRSNKTLFRWLGAACIVAILGIGVSLINQSMTFNSEVATTNDVALPPAPSIENSRISIDNIYDSTISEKVTSYTQENKVIDKINDINKVTSRKSNNTKDNYTEEENLDYKRNERVVTNETNKSKLNGISNGIIAPTTAHNWQADVGFANAPENSPNNVSGAIDINNLDEIAATNNDFEAVEEPNSISVNDELESLSYNDDVVFANRASTTFKKEEYEKFKESKSDSQKTKKEKNKKDGKSTATFDDEDQILPAVALANDYNINLEQEIKAEALEKSKQKSTAGGASDSYGYQVIAKTISITLPYAQTDCDTLKDYKFDSLEIILTPDNFKVEACTAKSIGFLSKNKFLSSFYEKTIPEIKAINKITYLCDTVFNYIEIPIIINYGLTNEPLQEKIVWQYDLNCPDNEMQKYVSNFYKLIGE